MLSIPFYRLAAQMADMHAGHEMPYVPDPFSLFNHHLAGVLVIFLGIFAFLEESPFGKKHSWVKFLWPTPLILEALNVIFRGDSELTWPIRLATIMPDAEAVQHKIFALIALAIASIELFRRTAWLKHPAWRQVLNVLMLGGAIFLLFHTGQHSAAIHVQHKLMGSVAIALSLCKIASDLGKGGRWLAAYAVPALMTLFGLQFVVYFER